MDNLNENTILKEVKDLLENILFLQMPHDKNNLAGFAHSRKKQANLEVELEKAKTIVDYINKNEFKVELTK